MANIAAAALLVLLLAAPVAYAVQYTVGDSSGWETGVDYTTWAKDKTFNVGDTLLFTYGSSHGVDVVTQSNYDNCVSSNPLQTHSGGSTTITLAAGTTYFICPTSGHCSQGMKLAVTVAASGSTPTTPSPPSGTPSASPPPPSTTGSSPPSTPSAAAGAFGQLNAALLGLLLGLGAVLALMG